MPLYLSGLPGDMGRKHFVLESILFVGGLLIGLFFESVIYEADNEKKQAAE